MGQAGAGMAEDMGGEGRYPQRSDSLMPKRKEKYIYIYICVYIYIYKENLIKQENQGILALLRFRTFRDKL